MQKSNIIYANYKPLLLKPTTTKAVIVTSSGRGKWEKGNGKGGVPTNNHIRHSQRAGVSGIWGDGNTNALGNQFGSRHK